MWESNQVGRSVKAKASREKYLTTPHAEFVVPEGSSELASPETLEQVKAERLKQEEKAAAEYQMYVELNFIYFISQYA